MLVTARQQRQPSLHSSTERLKIFATFYGQKYLYKLATRTIVYHKYSHGIAIFISPSRFANNLGIGSEIKFASRHLAVGSHSNRAADLK